MPVSRVTRALILCLYFFAALQFVRYYSKTTVLYLNMPAYLAGQERLPFQERVLPIVFLDPIMHSRWIAAHLFHQNGNFTADRGAFYVLSLLALLVAAGITQKLYGLLSPTRTMSLLVFPVFLFAVMWTYSIHSEANFSYPYDMLSLAFFTAGLYAVYQKRFLLLALVVLLGTFNRETTLFLIGIFVLDAASVEGAGAGTPLRARFRLRDLPWVRLLLLCALWLAVKLPLAHTFAHNDGSENFVRIGYNLNLLRPRLLPALLNICGYTLPVVLLLRRDLRPTRFANYLYILPLWFAVMFWSGVLVETRIYGELCSYSAIALVLIIERHLERHLEVQGEAGARERDAGFPAEAPALRRSA